MAASFLDLLYALVITGQLLTLTVCRTDDMRREAIVVRRFEQLIMTSPTLTHGL